MAFENARYAAVNRSSSNIPVYEKRVYSSVHAGTTTAGGKQIGTIYPNEFYTVIPNANQNITSYEIIFRNSSGIQAHGFIETIEAWEAGVDSNYPWVKDQEPYNYYNSNGSTLVAAATEYINNEKYYIFTVNGSARKYMTPGGESMGTIPVGTKLAAKSSATGQTYGGYMVFYKKKSSNGSWQNLIAGETYGFVDLGLDVGSMPSDRPIR